MINFVYDKYHIFNIKNLYCDNKILVLLDSKPKCRSAKTYKKALTQVWVLKISKQNMCKSVQNCAKMQKVAHKNAKKN